VTFYNVFDSPYIPWLVLLVIHDVAHDARLASDASMSH
jgi:hypothetical protein